MPKKLKSEHHNKVVLQTTVKFEDRLYQYWMKKPDAYADIKSAVHVEKDIVDGHTRVLIYTDDGHGNGLLMLTIDMN